MTAYYNEIDPKAAAWIRENIKAGLIAPGVVDERSILEVNPYELTQYTQHHFFAGIGGWSYALKLCGWPDGKPVSTASCPCQPFSVNGLGLAEKDSRHLWPVFRDILVHLGHSVAFGEQVASPAGREWLAGVRADLEGVGYEVGAADLCAAGIGAPHVRQRLYWMANAESKGWTGVEPRRKGRQLIRARTGGSSSTVRMEYSEGHGWQQRRTQSNWWGTASRRGNDGRLRRINPGVKPLAPRIPDRVSLLRGSGNAIVPELAAVFIQAYLEI